MRSISLQGTSITSWGGHAPAAAGGSAGISWWAGGDYRHPRSDTNPQKAATNWCYADGHVGLVTKAEATDPAKCQWSKANFRTPWYNR